ncbi:class I SAM-dependent methyltransferase [Candidatus Daviesbacteria bacterium]|nr:class I SAM-dependent methyltransferase [Candidatus Daviesbacteria bacterium]
MSKLRSAVGKIQAKLWANMVSVNLDHTTELLESNKKANFLDLGCNDGLFTQFCLKTIKTKNIYGVDIDNDKVKQAKKLGVKVVKCDLNEAISFKDNFFDVVMANQVIEHLYQVDNFISEIYRILKPGGYTIVSTENASSWCNIFASIMGWQIFSLTNTSSKMWGLGNPLSFYKQVVPHPSARNHVRIYNIRGLKELFEAYGFKVEKISGAGYFPLPAFLGNIDPTHCHFMTFKIRKPHKL